MLLKQLKKRQMDKEILNRTKALESKINYIRNLIDLLKNCHEISIKGNIPLLGVDDVENLSHSKLNRYSELQSKLIHEGTNIMIDICEKYLNKAENEFEQL